jgi:endonuclease G
MCAAIPSPHGYDFSFLGRDLPFPGPVGGPSVVELVYTHFTVLMHSQRRLALATGVNIDGNLLVDVERANAWHLDPRIPEDQQIGEAVYTNNDLDRGHLVRRRDPVWGDVLTAKRANTDTFAYTNAAPQAGAFNQAKGLWLGLEDHVLNYAESNGNRISVFTAPVLGTGDSLYRGVKIPQAFWKVAAWTTITNGTSVLQAAGFVLDQSPQLAALDLAKSRAQSLIDGTPPPLGPFHSYQVPILDIAGLTGLDMDSLSRADVLGPIPAIQTGADPRERWVELADMEAVRLA